jgi:adenosylcobinamide kinase / adenosylcobinamide-phosphate guanylyltransferase
MSLHNPRVVLVTGPARSGKSEWAEHLAHHSQQSVIYVATAQLDPTDQEWQARIDQHQQRRPAHWSTLHAPEALSPILQAAAVTDCLLIDSLGTWVANSLEHDQDTWTTTAQDFLIQLQHSQATIILVAEETGWGLVPAYPGGRVFRDRLGHLTRQVGTIAEAVYLVVAGYALNLKTLGIQLPEPGLNGMSKSTQI